MGYCEVSLGDAIGAGTPVQTQKIMRAVMTIVLVVGWRALADILMHLVPFGNVATEDVVYMLNGCGVDTGIDFDKFLETNYYVLAIIGGIPI